jgi:ferritin-like metal-binding protein YciE
MLIPMAIWTDLCSIKGALQHSAKFMKPLERLFWEELAEMRHVEDMLDKSLFRMHAALTSPAIKEALEAYRDQVRGQALRIRKIFEMLDVPARERKCDTMMALLTRGQQMMLRVGPGAALDAALLSLCCKINAYKCVAYETLLAWAELTVMAGQPAAQMTLRQLTQTEVRARAALQELTEEANDAAGDQVFDSPRPRGGNAVFARARSTSNESWLD